MRVTEETMITLHDIKKLERDVLEEALLESVKYHIRKDWTSLARLRYSLLQQIIPDIVSFETLLEAEGNHD